MATTKLNILFALLAAATTLHVSTAQTTHVVGDALGWTVPPGGSVSYVTWAARQTFTVGDFLSKCVTFTKYFKFYVNLGT